jgi:hypothetical protein
VFRGPADGALLLIAPALFEEMNRTRRLVALACAALARAGVRSCLPDLPGTGDHDGPIGEASIERWRAAFAALARALGKGRAVHVLTMRAGALIAPETGVRSLYRVAPPRDGTRPWRDLLRARAAGAAEGGDPQTVAALEAASRAGADVDAIGYVITAALAQSLREAQATAPPCPTRAVATAPGDGIDAVLPGRPPWLNAEPEDVAPLADALAADWRAWIAAQTSGAP